MEPAKQSAGGARRPEPSRQRGIALVAVLGFLVAMSLIALGVVAASRVAVTGASRHLARVQAEAAVQSGVNAAIAELVAAQGFVPAVVKKPLRLSAGGFTVTVRARPERSKADLNHADAHLLSLLFRAAGAGREQALGLAAAVEDWRDEDDLLHLNGAERRQYEEAGLSYAPANRPFASADELRLVLGIGDRLYDCVRTRVTVHGQTQGIELATADRAIQREAGWEGSGAELESMVISAGQAFEIEARIDDRNRGLRSGRRVVVRLTGNVSEPHWVLADEPLFPLEDAARKACPRVQP